MANLNQDSPLHLADALAGEIAKTPAQTLLAEVAQDLGDRRALASEFDAVVARALQQSRRKELTAAVKNGGAWVSRQLFGKPLLVRVGTLAALVIAVVGYHYHDEQLAVPPIKSVNLQARSQGQPAMPPSYSAFNNENPADQKVSVEDKIPVEDKLSAAPMPSPLSLQAQSDLQKAREAYDIARARQARSRATQAFNRGDDAAAIAALDDALRSCTKYCRPELRGELTADLERAQSAHKRIAVVAVTASAPPPVNAAAAVAPARSAPLLAWPAKGHIVVRFGAGSTTLADPRAQVQAAGGITIAVSADADIRAAADGIVSYVGADKKGGKLLSIRHDDDLTSGYGHVRRVLVKTSDQVHRGEVIAKGVVASRGAQPQLYFEVRKGAAPIDPMQYLPPHQ
jgi:murein DD-endopeptidase MepM/ murein hydrolase activator NlpD